MSGLDLSHIKYSVVAPALSAVGLGALAAVNLVTGTGLVESNYEYLRQLGSGPALGLWQMEPTTAHDIYGRWLALPAQRSIKVLVDAMLPPNADIEERIVTDMRFAAVMCRLRYRMSSAPLPAANDAAGLAQAHKQIYNTAAGAADVARNTPLFRMAIAAVLAA